MRRIAKSSSNSDSANNQSRMVFGTYKTHVIASKAAGASYQSGIVFNSIAAREMHNAPASFPCKKMASVAQDDHRDDQ
jgi:hypothetical protein